MSSQNCTVCQAIKGNNGIPVYEDEDIIALLDENPTAAGHIAVMPKEHFPIFEQVPDYLINKLFHVVNKLSIVAFETLRMQGTNIIISNGVAAGQALPHFMVNIIPRQEGDGLNFQWQPKQLNEEEFSTVEILLKEQAKSVGGFQTSKPDEVLLKAEPVEIKEKIPKPKAKKEEEFGEKKGEEQPEQTEEEENYLIKQLRRIG